MKYGIVISTAETKFGELILKQDLYSNMKKAKEYGYDGVELAIRNTADIDISEVKNLASRLGLDIPVIGTGQINFDEQLSFSDPVCEIREKAVERVNQISDIAKALGSAIIIGLVRGTTNGHTENDSDGVFDPYGLVRECIRKCLAYSKEWGTTFLIEPMHRYHTDIINTIDAAREFIESFPDPSDAARLGILIDTWHMNIEEADCLTPILRNLRYIRHVHLADSNRLAPGYGHFDFRAFMSVLLETGYHGYGSFEVIPWPTAEICAVEAIRHMRRIEKQITCRQKFHSTGKTNDRYDRQ